MIVASLLGIDLPLEGPSHRFLPQYFRKMAGRWHDDALTPSKKRHGLVGSRAFTLPLFAEKA